VVTKKSDYPSYRWNTDLYKMFFEIGLKGLIHRHGILTLITPRFYLLNKDDCGMREFFLKETRIHCFAACNPFETAVTENIITILSYGERQKSIPTYTHEPEKQSFKDVFPVNVSYCLNNKLFEIVLGLSPKIVKILNTMKENSDVMLCDCISSKRGAELSKKVLRSTTRGRRALIGMDVKKYQILWNSTFLDESNEEFKRLKNFFNNHLIYLRRVDTCLEATYSVDKYAFNKNIYGLLVSDNSKYSPFYLLAIINSKAADFYYKKRFTMKKEEAFPEIQSYLYEQLPIPPVKNNVLAWIEESVKELLSKGGEIKEVQDKLDKVIFSLYGLTEEDILIINNSMMASTV